jgi:hypothetical protein
MRDLRMIGHFNAAKPVTLAQLDAGAQTLVCAAHATEHIFGVAETAEGRSLQLDISRLAGQRQAPAVLLEATLDVGSREMQIAAQEVDSCLFRCKFMCDRNSLGLIEVAECAVSRSSVTRLTPARPISTWQRCSSSEAVSSASS